MYVVKIYDGPEDKKGITIHSATVNSLKLDSGTIKKEVSKIDSFLTNYNLANPAYGRVKPYLTLVNVLNTKTNKYDFEGRALSPTDEMNESGEFATSFVFEGELGYLHDAQQRHLEFRGSVRELLKTQLDYFNSQVEPYKRFEIGIVTVTDPNDYVYLYLSAENSTYDSIQDTLIDRLGGELQIRKENGVRYLDYLVQVGDDSPVEIELAKNLLSISRKVDPTTVISRLTPLGERLESEDEEATDASQARLTIDSVNGGKPYLDRMDLIKQFGYQGGSVTWDDVTIASNLKTKGMEWLNSQKTILYQYTVDAVDLFKIGLASEEFKIGNTYPVKNSVMGINERLRIIAKSIDINAPEKDSLTIGDKFKNANEYQADLNKSNQKVFELENMIKSQVSTIGNLKITMKLVNETVENINTQIEQSDLPGLNQSINNLNSIVDELTIQLGNLSLATQEKDGLMAAVDKIKLDQLKKYSVATSLTDGLMSKSDKASLDGVKVDIGNTELLETINKTNLVAAINEVNAKIAGLEL